MIVGTTNTGTTGGSSYYGSNTSNYIMAQRLGGVCHGTLWQIREIPSHGYHSSTGSYSATTTTSNSTSTSTTTTTLSSSSWFGGTITEKMYTYCVLVGTCLITYESYSAYERGDMPYSTMTIVGASAGSFKVNNTTAIRRLVQSTTTSKNTTNTPTPTATTNNATATIDFRIVSDQGTHIHCQTCTSTCRMIWLAAFQSGIEDALLEQTITTTSSRHSRMVPPPVPDICKPDTSSAVTGQNKLSTSRLFRSLSITSTKLPRYCISCGAVEVAAGMTIPLSLSSNIEQPNRKSVRKELASAVAEGMKGGTNNTEDVDTTTTTDTDTSSDGSRIIKLPASFSPAVVSPTVQQPRLVGTLGSNFSTPLTQYGKEMRCDVCFHCSIAQGLVDYMEFCSSLLEYRIREKKTLQLASKMCWKAIYDTSAALYKQQQQQQKQKIKKEKEEESKETTTANGDEDENNDDVVNEPNDDKDKINRTGSDNNQEEEENTFLSSFEEYFTVRWQNPIPENTTTVLTALMKLSTEFSSYRKQSTMLQSLYNDFFDGRGDNGSCISVVEFLESLDELAEYSKNAEKDAITQLKKEAFRIAGDMGTAMKLFLELALTGPERGRDHNSIHSIVPIDADKYSTSGSMSPTSTVSSPRYNNGTKNSNTQHLLHRLVSNINPYDTEMLTCVLEFFLDLCERGDLATVAFFWPQICHIHLRMLPAKNAMELARIDLVEDFLLTVSTQYSIHLALDLTWTHTADLEESLLLSSGVANPQAINTSSIASGSNSTITTTGDGTSILPKCRQRRFAVLRFLCELESMLFDETGTRWGCTSTTTRKFVGGSGVALGSMLSPTPHQAELLQQAAANIQALRNQIIQTTPHDAGENAELVIHSTSRSATSWYEKKRKSMQALPPEQLATEKLRFARNADYYTCHLNFSKRLSDIAEKLRHTEVETRSGLLQQELELLNSSGLMGGDPLNRILTEGFIRALRIPTTEGHVFRSKERTPVLLLVEVVDESAEPNDENEENTVNPNPSSNQQQQAIETSNETKDEVREADSINPDPSNDNEEEEIETLNVDLVDESVTKLRSLGRRQQSSSIFEDNNSVHTCDGQPSPPQHVFNSQGSSDAQSVTRQRTPSDMSDILEGASSGSRPSPRPGALKRFDDMRPLTPKSDVQCLVHAVVEHQLNELSMPNLSMLTPERRDHGKRELSFNKGLSDTQANKSFDELKDFEDNKSSHKTSGNTLPSATSSNDIPRTTKKLSTLSGQNFESSESSAALFAPMGDVRREVLTTIMMRGIQGNSIAAGAADSVQRTLKELGRKRATELLLKDDDDVPKVSPEKDKSDAQHSDTPTTRQKMESLGLSPVASLEDEELAARPTEEDEIMEAIRLILIQNRVAQGKLSQADAAKVLQYSSLSPSNYTSMSRSRSANGISTTFDASDYPTIDAGDVDPRLVGCGPLPPAILQAMTLWKAEMVTNAELLELVKKDVEFVKHSVLVDSESINTLKENSAFWGRFAFGERWAEKKSRIASTSPVGSVPGWDLLGVIVKSNDDLRQEAFIMQLIELSKEAFELAGLELWVSPYRILATGRTTGVIECVRNAMSFDALKKRPGYGKGGLREHLLRMTEFTADPGEAFKTAQRNFVRSLAAYSLLSYFFLFKDRHNGNLLLDTAGHVIHIDFGFVFGIAPGGSFSLEMSTPFKLTEEMLDVMGGLRSPLFSEFVTLFCCGFLTMQSYCDTFLTIVEITCTDSTFKCFEGRDTSEIVSKLRERFCPDLNKEETVTYALDLIKQATTSYGTRQYDIFQYLSQGIVA